MSPKKDSVREVRVPVTVVWLGTATKSSPSTARKAYDEVADLARRLPARKGERPARRPEAEEQRPVRYEVDPAGKLTLIIGCIGRAEDARREAVQAAMDAVALFTGNSLVRFTSRGKSVLGPKGPYLALPPTVMTPVPPAVARPVPKREGRSSVKKPDHKAHAAGSGSAGRTQRAGPADKKHGGGKEARPHRAGSSRGGRRASIIGGVADDSIGYRMATVVVPVSSSSWAVKLRQELKEPAGRPEGTQAHIEDWTPVDRGDGGWDCRFKILILCHPKQVVPEVERLINAARTQLRASLAVIDHPFHVTSERFPVETIDAFYLWRHRLSREQTPEGVLLGRVPEPTSPLPEAPTDAASGAPRPAGVAPSGKPDAAAPPGGRRPARYLRAAPPPRERR